MKGGLTKSFARIFVRDESGQAITEYILLLTLTLTAAIALARGITSALNTSTLALGGQLEKDLKTGRVSLDIWKN